MGNLLRTLYTRPILELAIPSIAVFVVDSEPTEVGIGECIPMKNLGFSVPDNIRYVQLKDGKKFKSITCTTDPNPHGELKIEDTEIVKVWQRYK